MIMPRWVRLSNEIPQEIQAQMHDNTPGVAFGRVPVPPASSRAGLSLGARPAEFFLLFVQLVRCLSPSGVGQVPWRPARANRSRKPER